MYVVMTTIKAKDAFLQIRIREDVKQDLAIVAELRGLSMSALINTLVVKMIRDEKELSPGAFSRQTNITDKYDLDLRTMPEQQKPRKTKTG